MQREAVSGPWAEGQGTPDCLCSGRKQVLWLWKRASIEAAKQHTLCLFLFASDQPMTDMMFGIFYFQGGSRVIRHVHGRTKPALDFGDCGNLCFNASSRKPFNTPRHVATKLPNTDSSATLEFQKPPPELVQHLDFGCQVTFMFCGCWCGMIQQVSLPQGQHSFSVCQPNPVSFSRERSKQHSNAPSHFPTGKRQ